MKQRRQNKKAVSTFTNVLDGEAEMAKQTHRTVTPGSGSFMARKIAKGRTPIRMINNPALSGLLTTPGDPVSYQKDLRGVTPPGMDKEIMHLTAAGEGELPVILTDKPSSSSYSEEDLTEEELAQVAALMEEPAADNQQMKKYAMYGAVALILLVIIIFIIKSQNQK